MEEFIQGLGDKVIGVLRGFDRVLFRGTLRQFAWDKALAAYLNSNDVLLKDFGKWSSGVTERIRAASESASSFEGRPNIYLNSAGLRKNELAQEIAERDGINEGPICIFRVVEPCQSFEVYRNRDLKKLELVPRVRKCLHLYHYQIHPKVGMMHVCLQTWFPFTMRICLNGREWLARQLDRLAIGYLRKRNCFIELEDATRAQELMDKQLRVNWPKLLDSLRREVNPALKRVLKNCPNYYWTVAQSEWATDIMFKNQSTLAGLYPQLLAHGMTTMNSRDVMRFLGHKVPAKGGVNGKFKGEVISNLKHRHEGMRLRHQVNRNSIKMYDKAGSVLRVETTIHHAEDIRVFRKAENQRRGSLQWRPLRRGIADLHRRVQVSDAANERYLEALAAAQNQQSLGEIAATLAKRKRWKGKKVRALNPFEKQDAQLLKVVANGAFTVHGFRNRDIRESLFGRLAPSPQEAKRRSASVSRKLRLLRAHGVIKKVPRTNRYLLTTKGRTITTALALAKQASPEQLARLAA